MLSQHHHLSHLPPRRPTVAESPDLEMLRRENVALRRWSVVTLIAGIACGLLLGLSGR